MSSSRPTISIGLPVYNGERFLRTAVESLLSQTFEDFELIVSDNASTDGTEEICREFVRRDARVRYVRQDVNRGAAWNFNEVFLLSKAPYFKWAASDDACLPTLLQRCVEALFADRGAAMAFPCPVAIDADDKPFDDSTLRDSSGNVREQLDRASLAHRRLRLMSEFPHVRFQYVINHFFYCNEIYGVIRSDLLRTTKLHRSFYGADKVLLAELALRGKFIEINEPLFLWRRHAEQSMWVGDRSQLHTFIAGRKEANRIPGFVRFYSQYLRSALQSDLSPVNKALCVGSVAGLMCSPRKWLRFVQKRLNRRRLLTKLVEESAAKYNSGEQARSNEAWLPEPPYPKETNCELNEPRLAAHR